MQLTLSGYSTALFSTWYFPEELGILFDCGDGCVSGLLQKSRKVKYIFISHADRDHLTGLLQFSQLNNRPGFPKLYYPKDSGSFPALNAFSAKFDPHVEPVEWTGIRHGEQVAIAKDLFVTPIKNTHVNVSSDQDKSLGYLIERTRRKLRDEFVGLPGHEIASLRKTKGEHEITYEVRDKIIAYSGDSPAENEAWWNDTDVLIHEATFLNPEDRYDETERANKHSVLEEVIAMVAGIKLNHLVLGHFSSRYDEETIVRNIRDLSVKYSLRCNVYAVLPGTSYKNIGLNKVYGPYRNV